MQVLYSLEDVRTESALGDTFGRGKGDHIHLDSAILDADGEICVAAVLPCRKRDVELLPFFSRNSQFLLGDEAVTVTAVVDDRVYGLMKQFDPDYTAPAEDY
mgnify:CR=1 FL=1